MTKIRGGEEDGISEETRKLMRLCRICFAPIVATCDKSKPSELVTVMGMEWTKKNPQKMWLYPTAFKQTDLCFWHEAKASKARPGRET